MKRLALVAAMLGVAACSDEPEITRRSIPQRIVVLGVDGMDAELTRKYLAEGRLPNLERLAANGSFSPLRTTIPPQSPVAWSTFITGAGPHHHGIYDFVHRDPATLTPYLSTSKATEASRVEVGGYALAVDEARVELLREGRAFWQELEEIDVPVTIVKVPAEFPPPASNGSEVLAGMGTPDLLGTYGTFTLLTTDPKHTRGEQPSGGRIIPLRFEEPLYARGHIDGPPNPSSAAGTPMRTGVEVIIDEKRPVAVIRIGNADVVLQKGEWSHWVSIGFDPGLLGAEVSGMVRLYLKSIHPELTIYVSPINLDPLAPAMQISAPLSYAAELAQNAGRFYTQGMPEDTKALSAGVLTDEEFLQQADLVWEESVRMLDRELARFHGGVLFFYFSSIDQVSHVMWRAWDPESPPEVRQYAHVIPELYQRIDAQIGKVLDAVGPDTLVLVMSDHGFAPFTYAVNVNTWLHRNGYLTILPPDRRQPGPLGHIDWSQTQAYALGLNQIFINVAGRERYGTVSEGDKDSMLDHLERDLEQWTNPKTGERVITRIDRVDGAVYPDRAPDMIVGFNRGYRSSDASAIGQIGAAEIERNRGTWSGDHCMNPEHVPGVLFSTEPIIGDSPSLLDLAPTILAYFGVAAPDEMEGTPLLRGASDHVRPQDPHP